MLMEDTVMLGVDELVFRQSRFRPGRKPGGSKEVKAAMPLVVLLFTLPSLAFSEDQNDNAKSMLLADMRSLAKGTSVHYKKREGKIEFRDFPILRYDDQPRRFLDATMWVWTDSGRPVAFEKIEAIAQGPPQ